MSPTIRFSLVVLSLICASCDGSQPARDPPLFWQPAETEPQNAMWIGAIPKHPDYVDVTAELARALLPRTTVKVWVKDQATVAETREALRSRGVSLEALHFFVDPRAKYFIRDAAVFLVGGKGDLALLDLKWSDYGLPFWCKHHLFPQQPELGARCASDLDHETDSAEHWLAAQVGAKVIASPLFLEGAAYEVNGKGTLLISETLALARNPGHAREELERELLKLPGIRKVIWLAEGLAEDPQAIGTIEGDYVGLGTGGHTDQFVRFADPHTILLAWVDEAAAHPVRRIDRTRLHRTHELLASATDQDGRPFRIVKVPLPKVIEHRIAVAVPSDNEHSFSVDRFPVSEGRKVGDPLTQIAAASYLNFVVVDGIVLVPSYVADGTPRALEEHVRTIMAAAFPGRTIQFIRDTPLNWHGGGLHCATLNEPKALFARAN